MPDPDPTTTITGLLPEEESIIGPDDDEADPDDSVPADLRF